MNWLLTLSGFVAAFLLTVVLDALASLKTPPED